jgi:hypothetical protein
MSAFARNLNWPALAAAAAFVVVMWFPYRALVAN